MELLKDNDTSVDYHPNKVDIVADGLSIVSMGSLAHFHDGGKEVAREVHHLARLGVRLEEVDNSGIVVVDSSNSSLVDEVKAKPDFDPSLLELKALVREGKVKVFSQGGDSALRYQGRLCVPYVDNLNKKILDEAHNSSYSIHPSSTKMYSDLRDVFWWGGMKKDIVTFVSDCHIC